MNKTLQQCAIFFALISLIACAVGPDYQRPALPVPAAYKEGKLWKEAQPRDNEIRGGWWTVFNDNDLNALVEEVTISNQSLAQAEAQYRQALTLVQGARANAYPRITVSPTATRSRSAMSSATGSETTSQFSLPFNAAWTVDIWGRVRRQVESSVAGAQASAANLQALRLLLQTELAQDYFLLRISDTQKKILDETVTAYQKALELTLNRYNAGVAAKADVVQATTQLRSAQAQAIDLGIQRAQLEHAIALLIGKAPAKFSIAPAPYSPVIPKIPSGIPSDLLERRPDIASAERTMAAANAQIGIAKSAYYPALTLSATSGYQNTLLADLLSAPGFFWSLGPALAQTLFDGGVIKAQTEQAIALYDASVAAYRQVILTSFQEVEDSLAALTILNEEAQVQEEALSSARESVVLTTNQYKAGTVSYLNVIAAQTIALTNEKTALGIRSQRLNASVLLIKALGGGWNSSDLYKNKMAQ